MNTSIKALIKLRAHNLNQQRLNLRFIISGIRFPQQTVPNLITPHDVVFRELPLAQHPNIHTTKQTNGTFEIIFLNVKIIREFV